MNNVAFSGARGRQLPAGGPPKGSFIAGGCNAQTPVEYAAENFRTAEAGGSSDFTKSPGSRF